MTKKKFSMASAVLSVICVVFVCEAAAPAAAIGNSQFFWWIFLIISFLLPYGLIVSELGTSYEDEGGLCDWVRRAYGDKWGSRVSFYYWINFAFWIASLAFLVPEVVVLITGVELSMPLMIALELAFVWIVVAVSFSKISDALWVLNLGAVIKIGIALVVAFLGITYAMNNGFANDMSPATFMPSLDASSLTYLSIILFNFMGFEVIATYAGDMQDPKKQIPKAIILGGLAIAIVYLLSSFGIGAAVPIDQISLDAGIFDALAIMAGDGSLIYIIVGVLFIVSLFGNMISWSFGVNYVALNAAKKHNMPKMFVSEAKNEMPKGAALINGVVATILVLLAPVMASFGLEDFFWIFFSVSVMYLLISYLPMFPAFLKLRKIDADRERVFAVPGGKVGLNICTWLPVVLLVLSIGISIIPLNGSEEEMAKLPILLGCVAVAVLGEVVRIVSARGRDEEYKGMDKSGDCDEWDIKRGYLEAPKEEATS